MALTVAMSAITVTVEVLNLYISIQNSQNKTITNIICIIIKLVRCMGNLCTAGLYVTLPASSGWSVLARAVETMSMDVSGVSTPVLVVAAESEAARAAQSMPDS